MSEDVQPAVRVEKAGPVTTVILNRPHARNAVDGPTAAALLAAFTEFDADPEASVAVLWGDNGTFVLELISRRWGPTAVTSCTRMAQVRWDLRGYGCPNR